MNRSKKTLGLSDLLLSGNVHAWKHIDCAKYRNTFDKNRFIWISFVTSAIQQTPLAIIKSYFSLNICVTSSLSINVLRPFYIFIIASLTIWHISMVLEHVFIAILYFWDTISRFYFNFYSFYRLKLIEWLIAMVWIDLVWKACKLFFFSNPDIIWLSEAYPNHFAFLLARLVEKLEINHQLTLIEIPITFQFAFIHTTPFYAKVY